MFSASLEIVLTVAYREATSRRHTHLTLEHLLYALAHDLDGERILAACGADLPQLRKDLDKYLKESVEEFGRGQQKEPAQTLAFRRVLQTALLQVQSAGRQEVQSGDVLAATLQQKSYAAELLAAQGVTRLDVLEYITHGISKVPPASPAGGDDAESGDADAGIGERGTGTSRDPLSAYALNLTARAKAGELDPLIGRTLELQRTMEILCRRRKNNPVFVGDAGVGKTALAEGLATRLLQDDVPEPLQGAEIFSLDTAALLAGTRFRGDFEERFKAVIKALSKRPMPILFIDEIHSTVGAGATTGGTMDLATLIKPVLTAGELRVIGSTTHEDFKHIEKDRALARRLQRVAIDEPSHTETVKILRGLRSRYEAHHGVTFTDDALEAAAKLAARHLRDYKLPDSAIDVLDEAGARMRLQRAGTFENPAVTIDNKVGCSARGTARAGRRAGRRSRGAHGAHPRQAGLILRSRSSAHPRGDARARGVRAGNSRGHRLPRHQAFARGAWPGRSPGGLLPLHGTDRRWQDGARQAARSAPRQRVHPLRHERVHGEACRCPADRRTTGICRLRAGRLARRRRPPASIRGAAAGRNRKSASRYLQHPAAGHGSRHADRQQRSQG